jgi:hypothetical protein
MGDSVLHYGFRHVNGGDIVKRTVDGNLLGRVGCQADADRNFMCILALPSKMGRSLGVFSRTMNRWFDPPSQTRESNLCQRKATACFRMAL